jgi:hypothetical protein
MVLILAFFLAGYTKYNSAGGLVLKTELVFESSVIKMIKMTENPEKIAINSKKANLYRP